MITFEPSTGCQCAICPYLFNKPILSALLFFSFTEERKLLLEETDEYGMYVIPLLHSYLQPNLIHKVNNSTW